jgi:hypothetical protein
MWGVTNLSVTNTSEQEIKCCDPTIYVALHSEKLYLNIRISQVTEYNFLYAASRSIILKWIS